MSCNGNCDQGRRCTCDKDPARELIEQVVDWAGIVAALAISSAIIGLFLGILWSWV